MWRRVLSKELSIKWERLERKRQLSHCVLEMNHGDGRCTMTTVWSRDGINLLRRDEHYVLVHGKWISQTAVYYARDDQLYVRDRGVRHPACAACDARCCKDKYTTVVLTLEEAAAVLRGEVDWPIVHDGIRYALAKRDDGACIFLTKSNRCGIYKKRRPVGCRVWFCGRNTEDDSIYQKISNNMGIAA